MAGEHTLAELKLKVTPRFYTLPNPKNSPNNTLKLIVTMTRSNIKSRTHHDVACLQILSNVPTKYQLPTPYGFRDLARTKFYRSRSIRQGQRSNQGLTMMLHTCTPKPMSLPSINFLHLIVSQI